MNMNGSQRSKRKGKHTREGPENINEGRKGIDIRNKTHHQTDGIGYQSINIFLNTLIRVIRFNIKGLKIIITTLFKPASHDLFRQPLAPAQTKKLGNIIAIDTNDDISKCKHGKYTQKHDCRSHL